MKLTHMLAPALGFGLGALLLLPAERAGAWAASGDSLGLGNRHFRIFNNFTGPGENDNQVPDPQFPGYQGAVMAIWKACVEWGSIAHGDGSGDPTQAVLGSGGANFDPSFQGEAANVGGTNDNIHSQISGNGNGVLAFTEIPSSDGWRIRYYENWSWGDGPGKILISEWDLQGVAAHEYGHALGLGHSAIGSATMFSPIANGDESLRSLDADDIAGCQAVYGAISGSKPTITDVVVHGSQMTITGTNFSPSNNKVWFTKSGLGGFGNPILVSNLSSSGTSLVTTIPGGAGPGDVLVQSNGVNNDDLSNAWPHDLSDGGCIDPVTYCGTTPNSVGPGATVGFTGTASVSQNDLVLNCFGLVPGTPGLFFYGPTQSSIALGEGVRCVDGNLTRLEVLVPSGSGVIFRAIDWGAPPFSGGPGQVSVGDEVDFQYWYRDPAGGPAGFNLSDGLEVHLCN